MQPLYDITPKIIKLIASVSEKIGEVNAGFLDRQTPQLRKRNKIKTIHSSLQIEGNTLTEAQVTALLDNKRVAGPAKDITEVLNAIEVYDAITDYNPASDKDFLKAHKQLMAGLVEDAGSYRKQGVGIVIGTEVAHIAPPHYNVASLMNDLLTYLKTSPELTLIKSCVFHYEMEFIHPFMDGNGRMGRLWQTVILMQEYPVFEFLPFEMLISKTQDEYYKALGQSDKAGKSTLFIEYMLDVIDKSLADLLRFNNRNMTGIDRIEYFIGQASDNFSRKDYMDVFKDISSATASRDLKKGVELGYFMKEGEVNKTIYIIKPK
jgi:Fic family protein